MKLKYPLLFAVAAICMTTTGCSCSGNNKKENENKVWWSYSTENLKSDYNYFEKEEERALYENRDQTLRFFCMKNENEAVQLMITPTDFVESYDFELSDVTGPNGTISKDLFSVAAAHYMNIDFSNETTVKGWLGKGYYPDALVPLEKYKARRMNYIDKGRSQALYINLKTTKDTPAGEFKGAGKLHIDNQVIDIPFEVKVYDAVLPDAVHQQTAFGIWYDYIEYGELENAGPEMNMAYYDFLVDKRLSPKDLPPELTTISKTVDEYIDNYIEKVVNNDKITNSCLPITAFTFSDVNVRTLLDKMIDKNIDLREHGDSTIDLFKKAYFYIDDEPLDTVAFENVKFHDKTIYDVKKELCAQSKLSPYPDLKNSLMHIPNIVTREYVDELVATEEQGGIQTWCPTTNYFATAEQRALYQQRQTSSNRECGENVWWYTCIDPKSPYPNFHLDASLMHARVMRYMQYDYNIEGQLFWSVNYYAKYSKGETLERDLWKDPISWQLCAGDGMLVYPGRIFGINGPITTLRMENILASNEEYEYLWMINEKVNEYNASKGTHLVTNDLLSKYYSKLFTDVIANYDVVNYENVRKELLDVIESLNTNLEAGMAKLIG